MRFQRDSFRWQNDLRRFTVLSTNYLTFKFYCWGKLDAQESLSPVLESSSWHYIWAVSIFLLLCKTVTWSHQQCISKNFAVSFSMYLALHTTTNLSRMPVIGGKYEREIKDSNLVILWIFNTKILHFYSVPDVGQLILIDKFSVYRNSRRLCTRVIAIKFPVYAT